MADTLRRLIHNETCRILQEKLESWYKDYYINSCNKNLTQCCEIMELNSVIQGQLFSILNQACREGMMGHNSTLPVNIIKTACSNLSQGVYWSGSLQGTAPYFIGGGGESYFFKLEKKTVSLHLKDISLGIKFSCSLAEAKLSLEDTKTKSATTLLAAEDEIVQLKTEESFYVAKKAFRQFKMRVRKTLALSYSGSEPLEDMVMEYIIRQEDLYDVQSSVSEVICALNISPKISLPGVDFIMISSLIRELCRIAFSMQTLDPPLDVSFGTDGELFSEYKYRRSYDSDFTAPLVAYHIWPALLEEDSVIVKGEAVTKRGALWSSRSRNRSQSRSRSASPVSRSTGYSRNLTTRSRSPSPLRNGSPSKWAFSECRPPWI
ncbi:PREDICTED: mitochondria-eating protein [Thamnophis sirtalis]|uniref:Mitochondria-eating protein n=1 Tax=Thamnophis sirtalis TaxID=35019 RepID=A0A6I9XVG0_9SAUR|nr:PREDICTED: mitochondria-eating protein [Thamnophis sirtalis]